MDKYNSLKIQFHKGRNEVEELEVFTEELLLHEQLIAKIPQPSIPIFMPFRYCCAGGTMLIRRLCVYLRDIGYDVNVVRDFLNLKDYQKAAEYYENSFDSLEAAPGNSIRDQYLIEVCKNKRSICYILDMQGELQAHHPNESRNPVPFFLQIVCGDNPIIWGILIEKEMGHHNCSVDYYFKSIAKIKKYMKPFDKAIVIFNKIDETPFMLSPCSVNQKGAYNYARKNYPELFNLFKTANVLNSLVRPYNCNFVTFSTGYYTPTEIQGAYYAKSNNCFPMTLWEHIQKSCK